MIQDILFTFLISFSPFGEARVGIPYGIEQGLLPSWVFIIGLSANLLVFPLFYKAIEFFNNHFLKHRWYRKAAIYLSLRARRKTGPVVQKYGSIGLMIFVMIPLPFTGAYIATIASYIFKINYKKSLIAINLGVLIALTFIILVWPLISSTF
ncbi:MAG: ligand-binding protein SH3 [Flavobacteriales bacterium]|nr:ligand-binding protein SH3 [Flavobacteriales bacterium]|tara:strand:- start:176 stop:631 length:456 start_codon:yes stop_codon:yes gene_type:complete